MFQRISWPLELQLAKGSRALVTDTVSADVSGKLAIHRPTSCRMFCLFSIHCREVFLTAHKYRRGHTCCVVRRCVGRVLKASSTVSSTFPGAMGSWGVLERLPNSKADARLPAALSRLRVFCCLRLWSGKQTLASSVRGHTDALLQRARELRRAGEMALLVKLLCHKHKDLSVNRSAQLIVLCMEMCACNQGQRQVGAWSLWASQSSLKAGGCLEFAGQPV